MINYNQLHQPIRLRANKMKYHGNFKNRLDYEVKYKGVVYEITIWKKAFKFEKMTIMREDFEPILRDWNFFYALKNKFWGKEAIAIEIYPPHSDLVDQQNAYHLFKVEPEMLKGMNLINGGGEFNG